MPPSTNYVPFVAYGKSGRSFDAVQLSDDINGFFDSKETNAKAVGFAVIPINFC